MRLAVDDAALGFFVGLLAAEGGLHEERSGLVTCLVPDGLGRFLDLPEEVTVTADPDAAREDGALLLAPGHPLVDAAAGRVLEAADVGVRHLPAPASPPPSLDALLPRIREQIGVDHGRIDHAGGGPVSVRVPVIRAGALVTYDVSADDRFHERAEAWVDASTGLELPPDLRGPADGPSAGRMPAGLGRVLPHDPAAAAAVAHRLIEERSAQRLAELARQRGTRAGRDEEAARTSAYYAGELASLEHRAASAGPERRQLLHAQAGAVRAEEVRRLREIDEKFDGRFHLRPFRLHLVTLPALSLPLVARRGSRTWPLTLIWLLPAGRVLPWRCPGCGDTEPLVAGKAGLGCRACLPGASLAPVAPVPAPPTAPAPAPAPGPTPVLGSSPAGGRHRRGAGGAPPAPVARRAPAPPDPVRLGDALARELWRVTFSGRRWPRRDVAPGSPLEALFRAYGRRALHLAMDVPDGLPLDGVRVVTLPSQRGRAEVTTGLLTVLGVRFPFTLRWRREVSRAVPGELLASGTRNATQALARTLPPGRHRTAGPPPPQLDPVARAVWQELGGDGLDVLGRGLAAWWRVQADPAFPPLSPEEAAASVADAVRRWPKGNPVTTALGTPDWWAL